MTDDGRPPTDENGEESRWYRDAHVPDVSSVLVHSRLRAAIDYLTAVGAPVRPGSRVWHAERFLASLHDGNAAVELNDEAARELLLERHRTASEVVTIAFAAGRAQMAGHPFTPSKLRDMLGGPEMEGTSTTSSRDTQFELYAAAQFRIGGIGVLGGEPDLRFVYERGELIAVAAKRVRSLRDDQLERHVAKAVSQIRDSGLRGMVALSIDTRFDGIEPATASESLADLEGVFAAVEMKLAPFAHDRRVLGAFTFGYLRAWREGAGDGIPTTDAVAPSRLMMLADSEADREPFWRFFTGWRERLTSELFRLWTPGPLRASDE